MDGQLGSELDSDVGAYGDLPDGAGGGDDSSLTLELKWWRIIGCALVLWGIGPLVWVLWILHQDIKKHPEVYKVPTYHQREAMK